MNKKMLIDATHPEEIRVAVLNGSKLEEFESEIATKKQIKGNIYLAKVVRIEPSLQAAFVDFGGNRHGFLPFSEIHPDYYYIPISDRPPSSEDSFDETKDEDIKETPLEEEMLESQEIEDAGVEEIETLHEEETRTVSTKPYRYKIQEVIKRRQIMLVQVIKEERGTKGAALTTYLTLPGRYCVLMPNAGKRSGGISRKISDGEDRQRLRDLMKELNVPEGMSMIVRTAGQNRNRTEIRRDYDYLLRLWTEIRETTLQSIAPKLIYAEGDLIKRAIRDIYHREIEQILVEGEEAYKEAKAVMKAMIPSHAKKVQHYKDPNIPLFHRYQIEQQIDAMLNPQVFLPSGGSIVINQTEALVAIDVNSGRATKERHIDETALKTNLEAADEIARQMCLRDLGGLIVVDFIDMSDHRHSAQVEKRMREATKNDRARIQMNRISQFGLLELSRQRLKPSLMEAHSVLCHHCQGTGFLRSTESLTLSILRAIEAEGINGKAASLLVTVPSGIDLYLLNQKRSSLISFEKRFSFQITVQRDDSLISPFFRIQTLEPKRLEPVESKDESQEESKKAIERAIRPEQDIRSADRHRSKKRQRYRTRKDFTSNPSTVKTTIQEAIEKELSPKETSNERITPSPPQKKPYRHPPKKKADDLPNKTPEEIQENKSSVVSLHPEESAEGTKKTSTRKKWWKRLLEPKSG